MMLLPGAGISFLIVYILTGKMPDMFPSLMCWGMAIFEVGFILYFIGLAIFYGRKKGKNV